MRRIGFSMILLMAFFSFDPATVSAFPVFGQGNGENGLNVASGFDVNTITTLTGKVAAPPERRGYGQHTELTVETTRGTVNAMLGPWWYWEKHGIGISMNQELSITGSMAQGKNGAYYIFVQRIENKSSKESVTLRLESGMPLWSRRAMGREGGFRFPPNSGGMPQQR